MKKLVAYFSASGVTESVAKLIAEQTGADLFEIEPETPYTEADLDWTDKNSRSSKEMSNPSYLPPIKNAVEDMGRYDTVFLGFPVWWYIAPTIINTFLGEYDFSGKTVVLFATSGSSGLGKTLDVLRPLCAADVKWIAAEPFHGKQSKQTIGQWVKKLGY